ncbi:unnamed protein product, partial [Chrysoparadoxa australica]
ACVRLNLLEPVPHSQLLPLPSLLPSLFSSSCCDSYLISSLHFASFAPPMPPLIIPEEPANPGAPNRLQVPEELLPPPLIIPEAEDVPEAPSQARLNHSPAHSSTNSLAPSLLTRLALNHFITHHCCRWLRDSHGEYGESYH